MTRLKKHSLALALLVLLLPALAEAGWEEGVAAFKSGNLSQAANEFQAVVEGQPDWPGGHFMLGRTYLRLDRTQEALTHLRKAYDLKSDDIQYQLFLGEAYVKAGRYADGVAILSKIDSSKVPTQLKGHLAQLKTVAYNESGQGGQAVVEAKKAAEAESSNANLWMAYGTLAYNNGQNDEAVSALEKAVRLDAGDAKKQLALARAYLKKGRTTRGDAKTALYQKAASAAQRAAQSDSSVNTLTLLGECHLGAKNYDGAISAFEKAAAKSGSSWLQPFYIGQAHTAKGNYNSAENALKNALDKTSQADDEKRIWKQLAFVYEKQKNFDSAIQAYNRAGDSGGAKRAQENKATEEENRKIDAENRRLAEIEAQKKALEDQLKDLPGGPPPRF